MGGVYSTLRHRLGTFAEINKPVHCANHQASANEITYCRDDNVVKSASHGQATSPVYREVAFSGSILLFCPAWPCGIRARSSDKPAACHSQSNMEADGPGSIRHTPQQSVGGRSPSDRTLVRMPPQLRPR